MIKLLTDMEAIAHESIVEQVERPIIGTASLTACQTDDIQQNAQSVEQNNADAVHLHSTDVIPSYHGPKPKQPMSMAIPQADGHVRVQHDRPSSLHEGGVSSHVQSRLAGLIDGVKALSSMTRLFWHVQNHAFLLTTMTTCAKVLSQTEGMSGKGEPEGSKRGKRITIICRKPKSK